MVLEGGMIAVAEVASTVLHPAGVQAWSLDRARNGARAERKMGRRVRWILYHEKPRGGVGGEEKGPLGI